MGWFLLGLIAGLLALLAIPMDVVFSLRRREGERTGSCRIDWLFGAVRLRVLPRSRSCDVAREAGKRDRGYGGAGRALAMLQNAGFAQCFLRMIRNLLRRIRIRDLALEIRLGLDDPADTGRLWGAVGPLAALLAPLPAARVSIEPDFGGEAFEIEGRGHVRVIPIQLLAVIARFLLAPATRRALASR